MAGSALDREIVRLAVPAFATLLAEPLYILADTAVVGHLGTPQLGGLAVAASILLTAFGLCVFLAYGTTAAVARLLGAGDDQEAAHQGVQGLWLGGLIGVVLGVVAGVFAGPLVGLFGAEGDVAENARIYLQISAAGLPFLLLTMAGTGYLRGLQDTVTPLVVAVTAAIANLVLELVSSTASIGASARPRWRRWSCRRLPASCSWYGSWVLPGSTARIWRPTGDASAPWPVSAPTCSCGPPRCGWRSSR